MEFEINNDVWKVYEKDTQTIKDTLNKETESDYTYVFGLTKYSKHEIWINEEMCIEQKLKTFKHELTHCYIWNYGLANVPNFNEEMVCDLVSSLNDFVYKITELYKKFTRSQ